MEAEYKVKLEVFEGPLDLLLYLIKKDEVDIYDISIERITSQYLEYLDAFQMLHIDLAGEFIVMAANLLYIKSRMLLPVDQQLPEEDEDENDPRWDLIRQLVEYKKFKEAAAALQTREAIAANLFPRIPATPEPDPEAKLVIGEVGIFDLIRAFQKVLKRLDGKQEDLTEIFEEHFTVSQKIDFILRVTNDTTSVRFQELFTDAASRTEMVVTFLALLELIRLKQLCICQNEAFGEILINRR